jgi:hypothetical protein
MSAFRDPMKQLLIYTSLVIMCGCGREDPHERDTRTPPDQGDVPDAVALDRYLWQEKQHLSEPQKATVLWLCGEHRSLHTRAGDDAALRANATRWNAALTAVSDDRYDNNQLLVLYMRFSVSSKRCFPYETITD